MGGRASRGDAAVLARAGDLSRPVALAGERTLAVLPALTPLLPDGGLRRGAVVAVAGGGATSLALALTVAAATAGSWVAGMGVSTLGLGAAAELGVPLERLVLVAEPGSEVRAEVVATLLDGFDLVLVGARAEGQRTTGVHRRLQARTRERGAVLITVGGTAGFEPDLRLVVTAAGWDGLEPGAGHLRARRVGVEARGRGAAVRPRRAVLWLPAADGTVRPAASDPGVAATVASTVASAPGAAAAAPPAVGDTAALAS